MKFGRFYDEIKIGDIYKHWPGRTISEADNTWFSLLTQNQHPIHIDSNYAMQSSDNGKCLVNGIMIMAIAVGQSVSDISGKAIANLGYETVEHLLPTYAGDTIYSSSRILDKHVTSAGDTGIVHSEITVINQRDELVMTLKRKTLIPFKGHPKFRGKFLEGTDR